MKLFLILFTICLFLQTSFIPLNLCLILVTARSLVSSDKNNYLFSFFGGISLGILSGINIGFWPLIFLLVVQLCQIIKKLPISAYILTVIPVGLIISYSSIYVQSLVFHSTVRSYYVALFETFLILIFYIFFRFLNQRFVVSPEIKLKIRSR